MHLISSHSLTLLHMQFNAVYICTKSLSQKVRSALFRKLQIHILQDKREVHDFHLRDLSQNTNLKFAKRDTSDLLAQTFCTNINTASSCIYKNRNRWVAYRHGLGRARFAKYRFSNLHILHFRCFIPYLGSNLITASSFI